MSAMKVVVMGLGYVGLPLAVRAAEVGHVVMGVDQDPTKLEMLLRHRSYVEDVSDERLAAVVRSGHLRGNSRPNDFRVAVIAVPTPLRGVEPDLSYVLEAGRMVAERVTRGSAVVLESTTYPGTTEGPLAQVIEKGSGLVPGQDFHLGYSPERIDPGAGSPYTLENTPKLVAATTPEGLHVLRRFYDTIVDTTVPVSSPRIAEAAKIFENTQANVNIALVNELAEICHDLDIDVHEMIAAAMTKGHSMAHWLPGPGVGGHCLPIDPMYLAWQARTTLGRTFRFAELADQVNNERPRYVAARAVQLLEERGVAVEGAEVLVLGVAYKPGVGDVRESPAVPLVAELQRRGVRVVAMDPHVRDWALTPLLPCSEQRERVQEFPLTIVVTHHPEFDFEEIASLAPAVLDCRNVVPRTSRVVAL